MTMFFGGIVRPSDWQTVKRLFSIEQVGSEEFVTVILLEETNWVRTGFALELDCAIIVFAVFALFFLPWASPTACVIGMRKPVLTIDVLFRDEWEISCSCPWPIPVCAQVGQQHAFLAACHRICSLHNHYVIMLMEVAHHNEPKAQHIREKTVHIPQR